MPTNLRHEYQSENIIASSNYGVFNVYTIVKLRHTYEEIRVQKVFLKILLPSIQNGEFLYHTFFT